MSKIAECPICGLCPGYERKAGVTKFIGCCGHAVQFADDVEKNWNQYAAAMGLAKDFVACDASRGLTPKVIVKVREAFNA
jgi:hypothetical protein